MEMKTSQEGLETIKKHEGVKMVVYADPIGLPTGGVGHLLSEDERKRMPIGTPLTEEQVDTWLREDVKEAEEAVNRFVRVELTQGQFDALVSFTFNVGAGALQRSQLLRLINAGKAAEAAREFSRWIYAGGKIFNGLRNRRKDEAALFTRVTTPEGDVNA